MARVNHKRVKQLLNEKRSKITDRQFFTSRILALHFEDMAIAQTRRYKYNRRVHVDLMWKPKEDIIARTDNLTIKINAGHPIITKSRVRTDRYDLVCGLFAHELGHCLYMDFLTAQTYMNFLKVYKWYPQPPVLKTGTDIRNEQALWEYAKAEPEHLNMLCYLAHYIENILEDGYTESRVLTRFTGRLGICLDILRERQWAEGLTLTQLKEYEEDGGHIAISVLQSILSYVKFGQIKYGDEPLSDERIQAVFELLPELDSAITDTSAKNRWSVTNQILVRCWPYWQDYLEHCEELQKEAAAAGGPSSAAETLSETLRALSGSSSTAEGATAPVADSEETSEASCSTHRMATHADAESANEEEPADSEKAETADNGSSGDAPEETSKEESESAGSAATETDAENDSNEIGSLPGSEKQAVSETETGRMSYSKTSRVSEPAGGEFERNDDYHREAYSGAASDIERMLDKMAEKAACSTLENERIRELNDAAQGISYGNIHSGVHVRVNRFAEVDDQLIEQYEAISGPLLTISRQLQKTLLQQLKDRQRGAKQTGLLMGRRLDSHTLHRQDGKVFYKNALPSEAPQLAVALLLDESGSMCSCDRCTYARAAAIILYDFCCSLHIPVIVYGHSTGYPRDGGESVELYSYAEFDAIDHDDKYRLMDISARSNNRDGAALRFVAEQLSHRPEEVRILILVSDGQPAADGYYGSAAEEDLRGIKQEYRRKGILFIAAAIGDDKQNIERIYGDSFLDITDLHQLPVKLTAVVKRHIRA